MTQREDDKRVRRGNDAAKGATVVFWRLAGGDEEELPALRVLLLDLVAILCGLSYIEQSWEIWNRNRLRTVNCKSLKTFLDSEPDKY